MKLKTLLLKYTDRKAYNKYMNKPLTTSLYSNLEFDYGLCRNDITVDECYYNNIYSSTMMLRFEYATKGISLAIHMSKFDSDVLIINNLTDAKYTIPATKLPSGLVIGIKQDKSIKYMELQTQINKLFFYQMVDIIEEKEFIHKVNSIFEILGISMLFILTITIIGLAMNQFIL